MTTRIFTKKVVIYTLAVLVSAGAFMVTTALVSADDHLVGSVTFEASVDDDSTPIDSFHNDLNRVWRCHHRSDELVG